MPNVAVVNSGLVVNVAYFASADDMDGFDFTVAAGQGAYGVLLEEGSPVSAGYLYSDEVFTPPQPSKEDAEEVKHQQIELNISTKNGLLEQATNTISVWQTKLLIGRKLTEKETASLNAWLDYIDAINGIDANTDEPLEWPKRPS